MPNITVPQIRSTVFTMLAIFLLAPLFTAWQLQLMGELHITDMPGFWDFCKHASMSSFWLATGWLFLKSPFASQITQLLSQAHSVAPDGTETSKSTSLTITSPAADPIPIPIPIPVPVPVDAVPDKPVETAPAVQPKPKPPQGKSKPK